MSEGRADIPPAPAEGSRFIENIGRLSFLHQVVERPALDTFQNAVAKGDIAAAQAATNRSSHSGIGHELEQLRIKDVFASELAEPTASFGEQYANVQALEAAAMQPFHDVLLASQDSVAATPQQLQLLGTNTESLYNALEQMIPLPERRAFIEEGIRKAENALQRIASGETGNMRTKDPQVFEANKQRFLRARARLATPQE
ncbi:MAG TPA: hypothetical protein VJC10_00625 [Patescibacteria group bacterium]|nr:hypothetical protein [Patescibacteria group bacterium]